jgi:hypothetical protein
MVSIFIRQLYVFVAVEIADRECCELKKVHSSQILRIRECRTVGHSFGGVLVECHVAILRLKLARDVLIAAMGRVC